MSRPNSAEPVVRHDLSTYALADRQRWLDAVEAAGYGVRQEHGCVYWLWVRPSRPAGAA